MIPTTPQHQFNLHPSIVIQGFDDQCWEGWDTICDQLHHAIVSRGQSKVVLALECYPGVHQDPILHAIQQFIAFDAIYRSDTALLDHEDMEAMIQPDLTDDPVFGRITQLTVESFFDPHKKKDITQQINRKKSGIILVAGLGASTLCRADILVYADLPRREAQLRFRRSETSNIGVYNCHDKPSRQYKRAFFVDWRVADRLKTGLIEHWDYWLDTVHSDAPKMTTGDALRGALQQAAQQPFSVVPYFDPSPWGGNWMKSHFALDSHSPNYGWCFNCVPEENSLLLQFGEIQVESPAINLVFYQPITLLGSRVYEDFGTEFPIRFDYLDTMDGGNLSFQVHPVKAYIQEHFGMSYTQDESYYLLEAKEDASVYLGLRDKVKPEEMIQSLYAAQNGGPPFDAECYAMRWPAKKHDHFLIPAGTVHCSGRNSMVLEISATPYIFTFKLWDWGRQDLDGYPRPIHIHHGEKVIQWNRTAQWVQRELINRIEPVAGGDGWREERTGLHALEFIETRRHWFTKEVPHNTQNTVQVLCLVEGDQITVESPRGAFEPFPVHYGEVFIVPAAVGDYLIRPCGMKAGREYATIKAFVR